MNATSPRPYQRCTVTVMDTTDPGIEFDEQGASMYVHLFEDSVAPVLRPAQAGELLGELEALAAQIKRDGEGKQYDCIVGVSGASLTLSVGCNTVVR